MSQPAYLLEASGVSKSFGGLVALNDAHLRILPGQIYGLIGPNGAGKTTFFNTITGLIAADRGVFKLNGKVYQAKAVHDVAAAGIARTFQNIRLFAAMTVLENIMVGQHVRSSAGAWGAIVRTARVRQEEARIRARALELLRYVGLPDYANWPARSLSYGDQRRLEIARALATEPRLLALDEPAAGMNATEKQQLRVLLEQIRADGVTLLLIEHDVKLVMGLCDRVTVLDGGRVICEGTPAQVQSDTAVITAYLGPSHAPSVTAA